MALRVHRRIPGGNAAAIDTRTDGDVAEVAFAADPHGGPEALWFCFRLIETAPESPHPQKLRLRLRFCDTLLGYGSAAALQPVYRPEGKGWFRTGAGTEHARPDGRREAWWMIPYPEPATEVALCYPYGEQELDTLVRKSHGYWTCDAIGLTQGGRPITRLSNDYGGPGGRMAGLYLVARQHSGETPGSWVLDGFLDRLAREKKKPCLVWAVPLANMDGVLLGDYGKDNFPYDLNRAWGDPPMRYETLVIKRDMAAWAQRCKPRLVIDFHAPGATESDGVYAFVQPPEKNADAYKESVSWLNVIAQSLGPEFAAQEFARPVRYASRWPTPTLSEFARAEFGVCALAIETPYALCGHTVMTQNQYREVGRLTAKAVLERIRPQS